MKSEIKEYIKSELSEKNAKLCISQLDRDLKSKIHQTTLNGNRFIVIIDYYKIKHSKLLELQN